MPPNEQPVPKASRQCLHHRVKALKLTLEHTTILHAIGNIFDIRTRPENCLQSDIILVEIQVFKQVHQHTLSTPALKVIMENQNFLFLHIAIRILKALPFVAAS